jgi:hypothetical protein
MHEKIALDKTEAVLFCGKLGPGNFLVRDGILYEQVSNRVASQCTLFLQHVPVKWSTFFKYLGSTISGFEGIEFLENSIKANATKVGGALGSACRSAVALPLSRLVDQHHSLVAPIALLNSIAWFPFIAKGGSWFSALCKQWCGVVGLQEQPGKDYVLLSWLDFGTWDLTAMKMLLKFLCQLVRAPPGSFLAALLSELRSECEHSQEAWLFGVLRALSSGLSFQRTGFLPERVDFMLERVRSENPSVLMEIFVERCSATLLREARARLTARICGPYQKLRVLQSWVASAPPRFRMRSLPFSRRTFHVLVRLVLGELPVHRIKAMFQYRTSLGDFGETFFGKRACLHCFLTGDTIVLDSEWHWVFDCTLLSELRSKRPYLMNTLRSIQNDRDFAKISDLGLLLNAIQNDSQLGFSLASFVRQAISLKESWLSETCVRGRLCTPPDHWGRDLFQDPPADPALPPDFEQSFLDGVPWFFSPDDFDP